MAALPANLRGKLFNYIWPWANGDHGLFGTWPNLLGIALGGATAIVSVVAALGVLDIWLSPTPWRGLAVAGAVLSLVLMIGFLGPTKLLPIALNLAVVAAIWTGWAPVRPG